MYAIGGNNIPPSSFQKFYPTKFSTSIIVIVNYETTRDCAPDQRSGKDVVNIHCIAWDICNKALSLKCAVKKPC
ncbi:hypothetical protein CR513_03373, partial [Mucuna pruriens]